MTPRDYKGYISRCSRRQANSIVRTASEEAGGGASGGLVDGQYLERLQFLYSSKLQFISESIVQPNVVEVFSESPVRICPALKAVAPLSTLGNFWPGPVNSTW